MRKIGPSLTVMHNYVPTMQDAYEADNERGSHAANNAASKKLKEEWPTVVEMARLIEEERDRLREAMDQIQSLTYDVESLP